MHTHQTSPFAVIYGALYQRYQSSFISVEQASDELSISFTTARSWLSTGRFPIPSQTLGSRRVVPLAGIAEFIVRGTRLSTVGQGDGTDLQSAAEASRPPDTSAQPGTPVTKRPRGRPRKVASGALALGEVSHG